MKILVFNESEGRNLGDQAIFLGMQYLFRNYNLSRLSLGIEEKSSDSSSGQSSLFKLNISIISKRNQRVYQFLSFVRAIAVNLKRLNHWKKEIKNSDIVVVGGGSLLINNAWTFPVSLLTIFVLCKCLGKNYSFFAISTRIESSKLANLIFKVCLKNARFVSCRDQSSREIVNRLFGVDVNLVADPALAVSFKVRDYPFLETSDGSTILNVMGPQSHGYFASPNNYDRYFSYMQDIARILLFENRLKCIVVTGGKGDYQAAIDLKESIGSPSIEIHAPSTVEELIEIYRGTSFIVATRLHSAIIAIALEISVRCFNWDNKVSGFFETCGRPDLLFDASSNCQTVVDIPQIPDVISDLDFSPSVKAITDV